MTHRWWRKEGFASCAKWLKEAIEKLMLFTYFKQVNVCQPLRTLWGIIISVIAEVMSINHQLLDGLPWHFAQTLMVSRWWGLVPLMIAWILIQHGQQVKVFTNLLKYLSIYYMDWYKALHHHHHVNISVCPILKYTKYLQKPITFRVLSANWLKLRQ